MGRFIPDIGAAGIEDDFVIMTDQALGDDVIGELRWDITTIGNASTLAAVAGPTGILRITTSTAAVGDGCAIHGATDTVTLGGSGNKEGEFGFRFRYPNIAGNVLAMNNFRIGIDDSVTATDPTKGIFIKSASGVLEVQAESTNGDRAVSLSQPNASTLTSGTTAVLGTWHDVVVKWWGENVSSGPKHIRVFVDGELSGSIDDCVIGNAETFEYKIAHWNADATTVDNVDLDIDYFYAWQAR